MKTARRFCAIGAALLMVLTPLFLVACATTPVPTDPSSLCTLSASEFDTWFESGAVSLNGVAKPADSVAFPDSPNCSFYKWSAQMFLWATSPAPPTYGGGGRIFNSPAFYDVSPLDANGDRTFISHGGGFNLRALLTRDAQVGLHGLPVIVSTRGDLIELEPPQFSSRGKQLILDGQGERREIERITLDNKRPIFFDPAGRVIEGARPLIRRDRKNFNPELIAQKFVVNRVPFFLGFSGAIVEAEQGQADGAVVMAQNGSLVYYVAMVNDVYAYFLTGAKNGAITPGTQFPTTGGELSAIEAYAIAHGQPSPKPFPDGEALAIELKTAWVEASGLANPNEYLTMTATIPTYDTSSNTTWTPTGQKTTKMALVGMHVVGSAAGHPEMIWATFDHKNNAPNATYRYNSTTGLKTVNPDFSTAYLFCAANPPASTLNVVHMTVGAGGSIVAEPTFTISPSNIIRGNAWGAVNGVGPNPLGNDAFSNSELISMTNGFRDKLLAGDVRKNYIMTGSTWTIGGNAPTENFGNPGNTAILNGRTVGTSQLANTTMETFQQGFPTTFSKFGNTCFSCHGGNDVGVSHIYAPLKPLF